MLLVLDVGNSNTVLGLYTAGNDGRYSKLIANWRVATVKTQTVDEYGVLFHNLFARDGLQATKVRGIIISSVVPPMDSTLREVCEQQFHLEPIFVEPGTRTGMPVKTDNPAEVGADRIVNCVAALERYGAPAIVVDFGTATTFDVISEKGEYLGGAIAPGIGISADALFSRAARLHRVDIKQPKGSVIGKNTISHMQIGLYYGYIGLVDGILERMLKELGGKATVVATGGLATLIAGGSKFIAKVDDQLTLEGLRILWERNHEPEAKTKPARPPKKKSV